MNAVALDDSCYVLQYSTKLQKRRTARASHSSLLPASYSTSSGASVSSTLDTTDLKTDRKAASPVPAGNATSKSEGNFLNGKFSAQ
eukprot:3246-Heterococcus_DN1.PRE.1